MGEIGHYFLVLAWVLSLFGMFAGIYAGLKNSLGWYQSVINATLLLAGCATISVLALGYGFLNDDYTNQYIWQYSNRDMDPVYKLTAIWGGMDGSLLFWAFVLSLAGGVVAWKNSSYPRKIMPWFFAVMNSSYFFFFTLVLFFSNPFRYLRVESVPPDGNGLNPLLQNPYMALHPPTLYAGFTLYAVPYALCMGALIGGHINNEWLVLIRRWSLIAWAFLTVGIVLGGYWAYIELGWGGFWAWDPVENASFLPWLTGTAFLHSVIVQRNRSMLKLWNVWLITLTYGLTIFGTFLTRSGIVQSVHAFASTDIGWVFLLYLGILFVFTLGVTWWRRKELRPEGRIESLLSRETTFLFASLVLLTICFATCWGVMFPVLSEAMTGIEQTVGAPYFNKINVPLFLAMIFLMGVGPVITWKGADPGKVRRSLLVPVILAHIFGAVLYGGFGIGLYPVICYSLCLFALILVGKELLKRGSINGGHLVHIGVLIAAVAITASSAHKIEKEFTLSKGESLTVSRYEFTLDGVGETREKNYSGLHAAVTVKAKGAGKDSAVLRPELRHYFRNRENTSEVALRMGILQDIYLVLAGLDDSGTRAAFKVYINPLQVWLWVGVLVMILGTGVIVLWRPRSC